MHTNQGKAQQPKQTDEEAKVLLSALLKADPKLERSELWLQLTNVISMRSNQDQVLWSIFGAFWAANALLLVALFTTGNLPESSVVGIVISGVGILLSLIWHSIQDRALRHLANYEELMTRIETKLEFDSEYAISPRVNDLAYRQFLRGGIPARKLMPACSIGAAVLWLVGLGFFVLSFG